MNQIRTVLLKIENSPFRRLVATTADGVIERAIREVGIDGPHKQSRWRRIKWVRNEWAVGRR